MVVSALATTFAADVNSLHLIQMEAVTETTQQEYIRLHTTDTVA